MSRWTSPMTLWAIGLAGLFTLSPFCYELRDVSSETMFSRTMVQWLAWITLPTVLFLIARLISRRSPWMQVVAAVAAVALAAGTAGLCWYELSHHITGNRGSYGITPAYVAFLFAPAPALAILLFAAVAAVWRRYREVEDQQGD